MIPGMKPYQIEVINDQSKVFQIVSAVIGVVFGWAGINITWTLAKNYEDVTFGSLLLAAPLFTVFLLGFLCFWFARMTSATNAALIAILVELRVNNTAPRSVGGAITSSGRGSNQTSEPEETGRAAIDPQKAGRKVEGAWVCYAHNSAWCFTCRNL